MLDILNYIDEERKKFEKDLSIRVLIQAAINTGLDRVELRLPRACGKTRTIASMNYGTPHMLVVTRRDNPFTRSWFGRTRPYGDDVSVIILDDVGDFNKEHICGFVKDAWIAAGYSTMPQIINVSSPSV